MIRWRNAKIKPSKKLISPPKKFSILISRPGYFDFSLLPIFFIYIIIIARADGLDLIGLNTFT